MNLSKGHAHKGTHGSLSKAGKLRGQNPRNWNKQTRKSKPRKSKRGGQKGGLPYQHFKKHKNPRSSSRRKYNIFYNETYVLPMLVKLGKVTDPREILRVKELQKKKRSYFK